jgi:hypothetical protein
MEGSVNHTVPRAEPRAGFSRTNLFGITRGHPVRSIDVAGILIGAESDNSSGLGAGFTRAAYYTAIG